MSRPRLEPVRWTPPPWLDRADRTTSEVPLPDLELTPVPGVGPEDVVLVDGRRVTAVEDGRVLRLDGPSVEVVADTGGRPLGVELHPDGWLVVCDADRGLLRVGLDGTVEVLVGRDRVRVCDNSAVAPDGTVYFSDSSQRFDLEHWKGDLIEHSGTGRLMALRPDGSLDVVLGGLQFSNGVALAPDASFVVVAETGMFRLTRVWLTGDRAGTSDVLADLPGFPDNVSTGSDGLVWVALPSPRQRPAELLATKPAWVKRLVWSLPEPMQPKPADTVWVQAYDTDGRLVHDLQGRHPAFSMVTGVREVDGTVHLGSLTATAVASFRLP